MTYAFSAVQGPFNTFYLFWIFPRLHPQDSSTGVHTKYIKIISSLRAIVPNLMIFKDLQLVCGGVKIGNLEINIQKFILKVSTKNIQGRNFETTKNRSSRRYALVVFMFATKFYNCIDNHCVSTSHF